MEHLICVRPPSFPALPSVLSRRLCRRFARPPTVWKWKDASARRKCMLDPGAWGRSVDRSGDRSVYPRARRTVCGVCARALGQHLWQRCPRRRPRPRPRMRQQWRCFGAKMGQGDGRNRRSVSPPDALGERRGGDRERDLVASRRALPRHEAR